MKVLCFAVLLVQRNRQAVQGASYAAAPAFSDATYAVNVSVRFFLQRTYAFSIAEYIFRTLFLGYGQKLRQPSHSEMRIGSYMRR